MRVRFERVDPQRVSVQEIADKYNNLIEVLERMFCHIGEDNLDINLKNKLKGEDNNG